MVVHTDETLKITQRHAEELTSSRSGSTSDALIAETSGPSVPSSSWAPDASGWPGSPTRLRSPRRPRLSPCNLSRTPLAALLPRPRRVTLTNPSASLSAGRLIHPNTGHPCSTRSGRYSLWHAKCLRLCARHSLALCTRPPTVQKGGAVQKFQFLAESCLCCSRTVRHRHALSAQSQKRCKGALSLCHAVWRYRNIAVCVSKGTTSTQSATRAHRDCVAGHHKCRDGPRQTVQPGPQNHSREPVVR
jgi:hypothetical protein